MAVAMRENVGLVHQMPFVCDREGFAAVLEKVSHMMRSLSLIGDKICAEKSTAKSLFKKYCGRLEFQYSTERPNMPRIYG